MQLNWIDWVIIVLLIYHAHQGWEAGVFYLLSNFVSFFGALWLALSLHRPAGDFLAEKFGIPEVWKLVIGYIIVGLLAHFIISDMFGVLLRTFPKKLIGSKISSWLGAVLSAINGCIIIAFFLLVILILPLRGTIKRDIRASVIARYFVELAEAYGGPVKSAVEEVRTEAIKFFTIAPKSRERIILDVAPKASDLHVDAAMEAQMVNLVNYERGRLGLSPLTADGAITEIARSHSRDMFIRRYFSHVSPDGYDVADRFRAANIAYGMAGENLAYAPDVETAHEGLMNSAEHKANILEPRFTRIGIGVIRTDSYGIMFTQNFSD